VYLRDIDLHADLRMSRTQLRAQEITCLQDLHRGQHDRPYTKILIEYPMEDENGL
jgi:hypothetical protein